MCSLHTHSHREKERHTDDDDSLSLPIFPVSIAWLSKCDTFSTGFHTAADNQLYRHLPTILNVPFLIYSIALTHSLTLALTLSHIIFMDDHRSFIRMYQKSLSPTKHTSMCLCVLHINSLDNVCACLFCHALLVLLLLDTLASFVKLPSNFRFLHV